MTDAWKRPSGWLSWLVCLGCVVGLSTACGGGDAETTDGAFTAAAADESYERGVSAHRAGDLAGAERHLRAAISINDRFLAAYLQLGRVLLDDRRPADALGVFDGAIAIRERSGEAWSGRAECLLQLGQYDDAAAAANEALARGNVEDSSFVLALALERGGDALEAMRLLEGVMETAPERSDIRVELARLYVSSGRQRDAVPLLERGARASPDDVVLWTGLAELYDSLQIWDRSIEAWEHVVNLTGGSAAAMTSLGKAQLQTGNQRLAIQALDQAIARDSRYTAAYVLRGEAEFQRGFVDEAHQNAELALATAPNDLDALKLLGKVLARQGDVNGAVDAYQRAVSSYPHDVEAAKRLADQYLVLGIGEQALAVLQPHAGLDDPELTELLLNAYLAVGDNERVISQLLELISDEPRNHQRLLSLVQVALVTPGQSQVSSAQLVTYAEEAVDLTGAFRLEYRLALIDALANDGQTDRARSEALQALEDLPNSPEVQDRLDALR